MKKTYEDELGKCYGKRGSLAIYKDGGMYAVFSVMKEFDFDENDNLVYGERNEAVLIGYVSDISDKDYAFDLAEEEIRWATA